MFPDGLRVSSFPDWFSILCLDSGIVTPLRLRWVKGICVFRCNLPLALVTEGPGSFTCQCGNMGVEQPSNKSQHTKLTLEKKFLQPLLPGFELATFRSRVRRFYQQASRLHRRDTDNNNNKKKKIKREPLVYTRARRAVQKIADPATSYASPPQHRWCGVLCS